MRVSGFANRRQTLKCHKVPPIKVYITTRIRLHAFHNVVAYREPAIQEQPYEHNTLFMRAHSLRKGIRATNYLSRRLR